MSWPADAGGRPPRPPDDRPHASSAFPPAPPPWPVAAADPYGRPVAPTGYTRSATWTGGGLPRLDEVETHRARRRSGSAAAPASPRAPVAPTDWPALHPSTGASSSSSSTSLSSSASDNEDDDSLRKSLTVGAAAAALAPALAPSRARRLRALSPWTLAAPLILSTEVATNLAYYSVSVNLVLYLTTVLGAPPATAAARAHVWTGLSYVAPLAGGALADGWLGRPLTILVAMAVFTLGLATLAAQAFLLAPGVRSGAIVDAGGAPPPLPAGSHALFTVAMICMALGTGGVKPNVAAAGADQFRRGRAGRTTRAAVAAAKASFFNWYYFVINVGALVASTGIAYVQTEVDWAAGFGIPAAAAAAATLAYAAGYAARLYRGRTPKGSSLMAVLKVGVAGCKRSIVRAARTLRRAAVAPATPPPPSPTTTAAAASAAADARQLLAMAPVWVTLLGWNGAYATAGTVMVQQAALCDTTLGSLHVPPASMFLCATLTLLILVPVYERIVLPALARRGVKPPSLLVRTGCACAAIAASQFVAAGAEAARLAADAAGRRFSVLWLVPQYVLVGVAEFFYVGAIEFWYAQAPPRARALASALLLSAFGVANLLSGGVIKAVHLATDWMPTATVGGAAAAAAAQNGRLDLYYTCVGAASVLNLALFVWPVAARYKPYTPPDGDDDDWSSDGEWRLDDSAHAAEAGKLKPSDDGSAPLSRTSPVVLALPLSTARVAEAAWSRDGTPRGGRAFSRPGSAWRATVHGGASALAALRRGVASGSGAATPRGTGRAATMARASSAPNVASLLDASVASLLARGALASEEWV